MNTTVEQYNSTNAKSLASFYGSAPHSVLRGKGVTLYDKEGAQYLDCGMALGSVSLGYAYEEVDDFVISKIREGINFSRPSYLEEELSELLKTEIEDNTAILRYSKSSSMLLSIIPRIARYYTGKKVVIYPEKCFLGNTEWYLSRATNSEGILEETKRYVATFEPGNIEALQKLFESNNDNVACVVMEPYRQRIYSEEFYNTLKKLCTTYKSLLVFDETITGFRFHYPLAQSRIKCLPDLTIIGKAFANGYSLSCVLGNADLMSEIQEATSKGKILDFTTTHAGESVGLAAAIKTLQIYKTAEVVRDINYKGDRLMLLMQKSISDFSLQNVCALEGQPSYFKVHCIDRDNANLVNKELAKHFFENKILFKGLVSICKSHSIEDIERISDTFSAFCKKIREQNFLN